jgi:cell division cycle 2-like protein
MVVGSDTNKIFMVMDYMEHDIKMLMQAMDGIYFSQSEVKCLMHQLLSAIDYMHGSWVCGGAGGSGGASR